MTYLNRDGVCNVDQPDLFSQRVLAFLDQPDLW